VLIVFTLEILYKISFLWVPLSGESHLVFGPVYLAPGTSDDDAPVMKVGLLVVMIVVELTEAPQELSAKIIFFRLINKSSLIT